MITPDSPFVQRLYAKAKATNNHNEAVALMALAKTLKRRQANA
ncbi:hypothetical protein PSS2_gp048 [Cyanophage PSS2]|nr:hypothetical protein PSS2_gp048 [Cyanophage PSS2]ACT65610.1 hypothetical protein [Cyanophage PSS2]